MVSRRLFMDRPERRGARITKYCSFHSIPAGLTPTTSWNSDGTVLTVHVGGQTDTITFDYSNADHRTRLVSFNRTEGHAAPTLTVPANLVVPANGFTADGQPGGSATFTLKATDYLGNSLPVAVNFPSGTVFPSGLTTVQLSATDSLGQETTGSFTVTVIPGAPLVTIQAIKNIATSGSNYGVTLGWPVMQNVTGYNVKRATSATGTFVNVSTNQSVNTFTDSGLANTTYYYEVTALYNSYEGTPSAMVSLPLAGMGAFTGSGLGTVVGDGACKSGNSYILTNSQGGIGGGGEQSTFVSVPWSGDGSFTVRLASVAAPGASVSQYASFAVMMRQNSSNNSLMAASGYGPFVAGLYFSSRNPAATSAVTASQFGYTSVPAPVWSRLVRSGNQFTAYYSYDGRTWNLIAPAANIPMGFPGAGGVCHRRGRRDDDHRGLRQRGLPGDADRRSNRRSFPKAGLERRAGRLLFGAARDERGRHFPDHRFGADRHQLHRYSVRGGQLLLHRYSHRHGRRNDRQPDRWRATEPGDRRDRHSQQG